MGNRRSKIMKPIEYSDKESKDIYRAITKLRCIGSFTIKLIDSLLEFYKGEQYIISFVLDKKLKEIIERDISISLAMKNSTMPKKDIIQKYKISYYEIGKILKTKLKD